MTDALKPCPFCGGTRLSDECTGAAEISGNTYQTGWIECFDCGCDGPSVDLTDETPAQNDYQLVRDAWNSRAALAAPPVAPGWVPAHERVPAPGTECVVLLRYTLDRPPFVGVDKWDIQREDPIGMGGPTIETGEGWNDNFESDVIAWFPVPPHPPAEWAQRLAAAPGAPDAPPVVPARVPLTDEQIDMITAEQWGAGLGAPYAAYRAYARAIEAAHGITAESQSGRDWSLLEATQESLREHMAEIQRLRAAVAAERERCAVLVEDTQRQWPGDGLDGWLLAAEIRAAA